MEHLNLPIFREKRHEEKRLAMDDYLRFVLDNLRYTVNLTIARKLKKNLCVGKKFILK